MTTFPSMTAKTSISSVALAAAALGLAAALVLSLDMQGAAGFRTGAAMPVMETSPVQTRASHATLALAAGVEAGYSATRARN